MNSGIHAGRGGALCPDAQSSRASPALARRSASAVLLVALASGSPLVSGAGTPRGAEDIYRAASRAVVGVTVRNLPPRRERSEVTHYGTGVLVDPIGLVATSTTVVPRGARHIEVYVRGGRVVPARLVAAYQDEELAILRIDGIERALGPGEERLPFLELGRSRGAGLGDAVYSFGNAFRSIDQDDRVVMGSGIISARVEVDGTHPESSYAGEMLETTASLNNGMDGGPLLDAEGRILGLLSLNFSEHRWLGTAVPIDRLAPLIRRHSAWFDDMSSRYPAVAGFEAVQPDAEGPVRVLSVATGGPAATAGLRPGDVLLRLAGEAVRTPHALHETFARSRPGDRARFEVERRGEVVAIECVLGGRF